MNRYFKRRMAGMLAVSVLLAGCGSGAGTSGRSVNQVKEPEKIDDGDWKSKLTIEEENPVSEELIGAINDFSYDSAVRVLSEKEGNRNYSPISLYFALALTAQGAKGETEEEFLSLLGVEDKEVLASECGRLFRRLYIDHEVTKRKMANSLWMRQGEDFQAAFLKTATDDFYTSLFQVDFEDPETGKIMGQWIGDQTGGLLTPEIETSAEHMLAIVNTVYLYDEWLDCFLENFNTEEIFTTESGEEIPCEFMNREMDSAMYYDGEGYTGTFLRLKNAGSMFLILPDEGVAVQELLTAEKMEEMFSGLEGHYGTVDLSLPKFCFEDDGDMIPMLQEMGLRTVFDGNRADFSDMTAKQVFISMVNQETHIGVNEDGVEAAAYTIVEMTEGAANPMEMETYELKFDRPFLFGVISEMGIPLFLGICAEPVQE